MSLKYIIFILPFFLACTHTSDSGPLAFLQSSCEWVNLESEPQWTFLRCELQNKSDKDAVVNFAPQINPEEENVGMPEEEQLRTLEARLKNKSAPAPMIMGSSNSSSPAIFIMQALAGISMFAINFFQDQPMSGTAQDGTLKAGAKASYVFPLLAFSRDRPEQVELSFTKPMEVVKTVTIGKDPASARIRN